MLIASVMPSRQFILWHPLLFLPSIFPSSRDFSNESSVHIRWPKYWGFSFSISPSIEYSGLISFKIDCLHLLAVQGTFRSLLQHHSSKASVLWHSVFFMVQLLQPYVAPGETIGLSLWIFVGRVIALLFNTLSSLSSFSCQEAIVWFYVCSHCLQWFWSPRRGNLSLLPFYLLCSNVAGCYDLRFF